MGVKEIFGIRIKELREERGLGVRECAAKIGISHAALLNYESCRRSPDIEVCKCFAEFFDVSGDYLLGLSNERKCWSHGKGT